MDYCKCHWKLNNISQDKGPPEVQEALTFQTPSHPSCQTACEHLNIERRKGRTGRGGKGKEGGGKGEEGGGKGSSAMRHALWDACGSSSCQAVHMRVPDSTCGTCGTQQLHPAATDTKQFDTLSFSKLLLLPAFATASETVSAVSLVSRSGLHYMLNMSESIVPLCIWQPSLLDLSSWAQAVLQEGT